MAFTPHDLVTFRGTLGAPNSPTESWVIGLRFDTRNTLAFEATIDQGRLDDMRNDFATHYTASGGYIASSRFTEARRYHIDATGHATGDILYSPMSSPLAGTSGAMRPFQDTVVISLRTAKQRGRAHAGRVYPPPTGWTPEADGLLTAQTAQQIANSWATLLAALNDPPGVQLPGRAPRLCIASKLDGSLEDVTQVRVGRTVDTMRSRRRSLDEGYVSNVTPVT